MWKRIHVTVVVSGSILEDDADVNFVLTREGVDYVILGATPATRRRLPPPPPRMLWPRPRAL